MAFGMIHRSEMQVLSVKFWRCSPISVASVHAQGARSGRLSRANARADRGRTHQPALNIPEIFSSPAAA